MRRLTSMILGLCLGVSVGTANGGVIFSDDFDSETKALNYNSFANWSVKSGTVDVIGNGFFDFLPGNGLYVDLDGSTKNAGILTSRAIAVNAGSYLLSFDLAGSRRGSTETTTVRVGSSANPTLFGSLVVTLPSNQAFTTYSISLDELPTSSDFRIQFENTGGDNIGILLDRVVLDHIVPQGAAVPEPSSILLGISAAGLSVAAARRRRAR